MSIFGTTKPSIFDATQVSATASSLTVTIADTTTISTNGYDRVALKNSSGYMIAAATIDQITASTTFTVVTSININGTASLHFGYSLKHSQIDYEPIQQDQLNYTSVVNGNKTNTHLGDYGNFKVTDFLWKYTFTKDYGTPTYTWTAKNRFTKLYEFYHTDVYFAPHDNVIMDSAGTPILCYLKTFKPYMYKGLISYDALILEFDTNKYHAVDKLII